MRVLTHSYQPALLVKPRELYPEVIYYLIDLLRTHARFEIGPQNCQEQHREAHHQNYQLAGLLNE